MNKTKKQIRETFLTLLQENSCQEITVSEICAYSDVARRSFYNHYKSKEEILSEICREMIHQKAHNFTNTGEFFQLIAEDFFISSQEHHEFISLLSRDRLFHLFSNEHLKNAQSYCDVYPTFPPLMYPEICLPYTISFYTHTALTLYQVWATRDFQESPEEMAKIYMRFVQSESTSP